MSYRVFWAPHAEEQLERLLEPTIDRHEVAAAARAIDQRLIHDPVQFGESRFDAVRVGFHRPLGAQNEVLEDVRTAIVYDVWRLDRRH